MEHLTVDDINELLILAKGDTGLLAVGEWMDWVDEPETFSKKFLELGGYDIKSIAGTDAYVLNEKGLEILTNIQEANNILIEV